MTCMIGRIQKMPCDTYLLIILLLHSIFEEMETSFSASGYLFAILGELAIKGNNFINMLYSYPLDFFLVFSTYGLG